MEQQPTYEETLIIRYLSGEAESDEIAALKSWLEKDEGNRSLFRQIRRSWLHTHQAIHDDLIDLDAEWDMLANRCRIKDDKPVNRLNISGIRFARVAAVLLLLIIPSLIYLFFFMSPRQEMILAGNSMVESALPDGSEVSLNKGAALYFTKNFRGKERRVRLEGEAYFDVVRNENKAFVISAGEMQIRVLGTSFYVNTKAENNTMEVVLLNGSIELGYGANSMRLEPGDKAIVMKDFNEIVKQENKDPNILSWKTRVLTFNNTPLEEVISVLEKVYGKEFRVLNPELLSCRITATFEGQSFESVLMVIESTLNIMIKPAGMVIEFSGEGCQ